MLRMSAIACALTMAIFCGGVSAAPSSDVPGSSPAAVSFGTFRTAGTGAASAVAAHGPERRRVAYRAPTITVPRHDMLTVDPSIAVKDTPPKEISLPGVMTVPGVPIDALDSSRAHHLSLTDGGVQTIYMSVNSPNRVELPYRAQEAHVVKLDNLQVDKDGGQNLFVYWKDKPVETTMYVEPTKGGPVLGLDIVPKDIPPQTYLVTDDAGLLASRGSPTRSSDDYIAHVQDLMEAAALNHTPNGYSDVDMALPAIAMNGLTVSVERRYSGADDDIYVYAARNMGQSRAVMSEDEFDGANVLAVSIFPKPVLMPGESTRVIVLARKPGGR